MFVFQLAREIHYAAFAWIMDVVIRRYTRKANGEENVKRYKEACSNFLEVIALETIINCSVMYV